MKPTIEDRIMRIADRKIDNIWNEIKKSHGVFNVCDLSSDEIDSCYVKLRAELRPFLSRCFSLYKRKTGIPLLNGSSYWDSIHPDNKLAKRWNAKYGALIGAYAFAKGVY